MKFVSAMQYYAYQLCDRPGSYLHRFGRLFHQYIVDQYAKIELARLNFMRYNQDSIRADLYQNVKDANESDTGLSMGKRIILPSTYKDSPRNLQQLFQDAMAVIRAFGKPDLFITVTCNPKWPEIQNEMKNVKNADKLTIIARVFKLKLNAILEDMFKNEIFGKVKAHMHVIEFQKRGLPHAHILIILDDDDKPYDTDNFDDIVKAEIPDINLHPEAFETVTSSMVHGPCGVLNPDSPCMENGKCSKSFPKEFCANTNQNNDGYPEYQRRDNKVTFAKNILNKKDKTSTTVEVDNRWIVPYNLYLVTKYNCHINVEICSSVSKNKKKYIFIKKTNIYIFYLGPSS